MKTWIWPAFAFALLLPAMAAADEQHVITMSGHGETQGQPDTAMLSAGVSVDAPTAAAAFATADESMHRILAVLQKQGVPDRDIQTRDFSIHPQYSTGNGQAPRVTAYQVGEQVAVRVENIAKAGPVLDALVGAGANQINGVIFSIHDPAALSAAARAAAVADARTKAETFAKAAGVSLGAILSVRESDNGGPRPMVFASQLVRADSAAISPGEETVSADVTITWEIK